MAKKRKKTEEGSTADVGMVMTCSLFLIILTFFILLNSIAVIDSGKQRIAIGSLIGSFGSLSGGLSPLKTGASIMPSPSPIVEQEIDFDNLLNSLDFSIMNNVKIAEDRGQGIITINENALFNENTHALKASSKPLLDKLCGFINKGDYLIEIAGHTDNRSAAEKGYASNWEITSLQAIQVLRYIAEKGNVSVKRVSAYGYGSQDPVASNDTRESRNLNRRVDIILKFDTPDHVKRIYGKRPTGNFTYKRFNFKVF